MASSRNRDAALELEPCANPMRLWSDDETNNFHEETNTLQEEAADTTDALGQWWDKTADVEAAAVSDSRSDSRVLSRLSDTDGRAGSSATLLRRKGRPGDEDDMRLWHSWST